MGIQEKIKDIELEMSRTQKNKATEGHLGLLKAKLAKLRTQLLEPTSKSGGEGEGFDVKKFGNARIALIGFPSVGKSTLLGTVTDTDSLAAAYEFTTLTCIPGIIHYKDCKLQLLDLPGIIEGAAHGVGRGRQVIAVAKSSDLVVMVLDASREHEHNHRAILERELESVGLRLNKRPADIYFRKKTGGGLKFSSTCQLTKMGDDPAKLVYQILHEYKIHNAEVLFREDASCDELIDIIEANRKYIKCLYVYNKIDMCYIEEVDELVRQPYSTVISVHQKLNLDVLLEKIWEYLGLCRVYTKKRSQPPDLSEPIVLTMGRHGKTVEAFCKGLHRDLARDLKFATVWGQSCKHMPQRVGLKHELEDEDVVQLTKKTAEEQRHEKGYEQRVQAYMDEYHEGKKKKKPLKS